MTEDDARLMEAAITSICNNPASWYSELICQKFAKALGFEKEYSKWVILSAFEPNGLKPLGEDIRLAMQKFAGPHGHALWKAKQACRK